MALGLKVLSIMIVACSFGLAIVVLPAHPQTASAFNCFVTTQECLETKGPVDLMIKMGMMPAMPGYG
jgi:hypothetical protein